MKPLRRKKMLLVTDDLLTGQERILEISDEVDVLSGQGSVDSVAKRKQYFNDCGCGGPVGGRCHACGSVSCPACHGRCHKCKQPLCLQCSCFVNNRGQEQLRFCRRCADEVIRKQRLAKVGSLLSKVGKLPLSPFVKFEK